MARHFFLLIYFFSLFSLDATYEYTEPQEVATTEGLPSSFVNQSVCAITGEYVDSVVDLVIPGPEPLTIHRMYASHSEQPWFFNHQEELIGRDMSYQGKNSVIFFLQQPSGSTLHYFFEKSKDYQKREKNRFNMIRPKGLTNGATQLSGKTNLKNQKVNWFPEEDRIEVVSGAGNRKFFCLLGYLEEGHLYRQFSEEKVNGFRNRYLGYGSDLFSASIIRCENSHTDEIYSHAAFKETELGDNKHLETLTSSDGRNLKYVFLRDKYRHKVKGNHKEDSTRCYRFYLTKVDHPYAPKEEYAYREKALNQDWHMTRKSRNAGRSFVEIEYYHKDKNHVGGKIGTLDLEKDDFRLDRVKKLQAPVGTTSKPITTHRFDYHAKTHKKNGQTVIEEGYTDVYDAIGHKTRYGYDDEHRLISIVRYRGSADYIPYSKEKFIWDGEGSLKAKVFEDGHGNVHHARTFTYDASGNVLTSTLCGNLTGKSSQLILLDSEGNLVENGYEREIKSYTYSNDGLNLLVSEADSSGKTIRYSYEHKSDRLKAKYMSYDNQMRMREFYFYDKNHVLTKKVVDDGSDEPHDNLADVKERHVTKIHPRTEAPIGLPEIVSEWAEDPKTQERTRLKRRVNAYSKEGYLIEQQAFDADKSLDYTLKWDYDLHGNLVSEIKRDGITTAKHYDLATDNLLEEHTPDVTIHNTYDYANRLIEQKESHLDEELMTRYAYDYLGNCLSTTNPYGHKTRQIFDDFGRVVETHLPQVPFEGVLTTPIIKKTYDIAGFPSSVTDANGRTTHFAVNVRGQATKITYPDGAEEKMFYSLDGLLVEKIDKNGSRTEYIRDPLGRITQETIYGETIKQTKNEYNAFHLVKSIDPEGNVTTYEYDLAGRLKETNTNGCKTGHFYDSLGRLAEIREYYGTGSDEYRKSLRKYDLFDRIQEEHLQKADGETLHFSCYDYDERGNRTLVQTGDQKTVTEYNSLNQPIKVTDSLDHETHIEYNIHFIDAYGNQVNRVTTTDPLGYQTIETYDAGECLAETVRLNPLGEKVDRQAFSYDLCGNQTQCIHEVIENGKLIRTIETLFSYNAANQLIQTIEASGTPEQKITRIRYNVYGEKEALIKPDGTEIHYTYDAFGRLETLTSKDISYCYEYNQIDQVIKVEDLKTGKETKREYFQKELIRESLENGLSVDFTYDLTGRARTLTFPDETGIEYVYNAVDLKEIHRLVNGKTAYVHQDLSHSLSGQILQAELAGRGGVVDYTYDTLGRCTSICSAAFNQTVPLKGFDAAGNLLQFERQHIPYAFSYDDTYQLNCESGHQENTYLFDSLSNRKAKNQEQHVHNALNQLIQKGSEELCYDLSGNLIRKADMHYSYDALDRLIQVTKRDSVTTYTYDPFNRRMSKFSNGEEELFLYQGQDEIGRWKCGRCQEIRLLGKNPISRTAAIEIQGLPYIPLHDMSGNVAALLNLDGELVEQYRYTAFGETDILSPSGEILARSAVSNPWQYAGKHLDEESSLLAFGMRYYDPTLGRWTTPDPAGFDDGPNLYAYLHNRPLQSYDQFGLFAENIFGIGTFSYSALESNYEKYCTPLTGGPLLNPIGSPVMHINIEDRLEESHFRDQATNTAFYRTKTYYINDFVNHDTGKNYSFPEMPPNKHILFINGIYNDLSTFQESLLHIANMAGRNVQGVFCPTFGKTLDPILYKHAKDDIIAYEGTRELQRHIQEFHLNSKPGATMMIIPHSRGAVYTRNALMECRQELRNRVDIRAIAPGAYTDPYLCNSVRHYESGGWFPDPVPRLDSAGRQRCKDTIITLQPHPDAPLFGHGFINPTYIEPLGKETKKYMNK